MDNYVMCQINESDNTATCIKLPHICFLQLPNNNGTVFCYLDMENYAVCYTNRSTITVTESHMH